MGSGRIGGFMSLDPSAVVTGILAVWTLANVIEELAGGQVHNP